MAKLLGNIKIRYYVFFTLILISICIGLYSSYLTFKNGLGSWNINNHVVWGLDITTFIFWIGIGHSGTFISAVLLLLRQTWRHEIARVSELMTIVSIITAGLIPLYHIGRFWLSYWIIPYPNQMSLWTNFKSPLEWDFFAISIYLISSILFFYISVLPDLNKHYKKTKRKVYFILSLGWLGTDEQWYLHKRLLIVLAGLLTALVISVHSIVSFDFAVSILPGWHSTINPVFFVAGAIFSGLAMTVILSNIIEKMNDNFKVSIFVYEKLSKIILFLSLVLSYAFFMDLILFFTTSNIIEKMIFNIKFFGEFSNISVFVILINMMLPNLFWFEKFRKNKSILVIISSLILISMWLERYVFVISPLKIDLISNRILDYYPSFIEFGLLIGSFGFFVLLFYISTLIFPLKSMSHSE